MSIDSIIGYANYCLQRREEYTPLQKVQQLQGLLAQLEQISCQDDQLQRQIPLAIVRIQDAVKFLQNQSSQTMFEFGLRQIINLNKCSQHSQGRSEDLLGQIGSYAPASVLSSGGGERHHLGGEPDWRQFSDWNGEGSLEQYRKGLGGQPQSNPAEEKKVALAVPQSKGEATVKSEARLIEICKKIIAANDPKEWEALNLADLSIEDKADLQECCTEKTNIRIRQTLFMVPIREGIISAIKSNDWDLFVSFLEKVQGALEIDLGVVTLARRLNPLYSELLLERREILKKCGRW